MNLNKFQRQAVFHTKTPLLIIAGAGTGKTTVLVEKIKFLISKQLAQPEQILALTFTEKAAQEIEERVDQVLPYGYFQTWIETFHSFCDRVLKDEIIHIGLSPNYKLQTEAESIIFLKKNLFFFDLKYFQPLSNPNKFIEGLIQHFSRLRDEDISPQQYLSWVKQQKTTKITENEKLEIEKNLELAHAFEKFQKLKIKNNVLDFADLIFYTLEIFRKRKNILQKYQNQFRYILVDEFQDTNIAQYELLKILSPNGTNPQLTVVGDDNQSIYKFRGAAISNILNFIDDYPTAKKVILLENYRSNQQILDAAYHLIKNNNPDTLEAKLGINKNLISVNNKKIKKSINLFITNTAEEESETAAKEILNLKKAYRWKDFALLVRANNHADPFIHAFQRKGIPYQFLGPSMLFKQPEIKDLIAYLKVIFDINDSPSFYRVLTMDLFQIDQEDLARLISFSKNIGFSVFETTKIYLSFFYPHLYQKEYANFKNYLFLVKEETKEKLYLIYQIINRGLSLLRKETAGQILYYFLEDSGYLSKITNFKTKKEERISLNISKFFNILKNFEIENEDASVSAVVDYLEMSMELGESPLISEMDQFDYDAINILTIHGAKGLEFPVVFLVNLTIDRFPTKERKEKIPIPSPLIKEILPVGDYHLQEERRLFYVALTRAKDKVYLTASNFYSGGKRKRKLSPFVYESLGKELDLKKIRKKSWEDGKIFNLYQEKKEKTGDISFSQKTFSYSQIDVYQTCPLKYKYQYYLKIPIPTNAALSFGESIHQTLQHFYQLYKTGKKTDLNTLLSIFEDKWIPIGYSSKRHQIKTKKEGIKILKNFYQKYHSKKIKIIDLEKSFYIKISDGVFVKGLIDRIDQIDDGIEIIDYKTGIKPQEKELKNNLQLSIYALAASNKKLYGKEIDQITLTFYFLQDESKFSLKKNKQELIKTKKEILSIAQKINKKEFSPKTGLWCQFCPFKINCEAWQ